MLAVGSYYPDNVKSEIYDKQTGTWTDLPDYPYAVRESKIHLKSCSTRFKVSAEIHNLVFFVNDLVKPLSDSQNRLLTWKVCCNLP